MLLFNRGKTWTKEKAFPKPMRILPVREPLLLRLLIIACLALPTLAGPAWAERMSVTADRANIRSGPGTDGFEILWEVERYHPVEVLRQQDGWAYFRDFEGDEGWVYGKLLGKAATVITRSNMVNIRSGPGTQHAVIFKAEKGVPFRVLGEKGDWYHIQSADGDKGYIHKQIVW